VLHLGYPEGVKSTTLSFRISEERRLRLEWTARHLKKNKNWILNRALEEYLNREAGDTLSAEARRQSLLASATTTEDEKYWGNRGDATG
jgi:predicted DNA-binding protein